PDRGAGHTYEQYVVRVPGNGRPDRDAFAHAVRARGVACSVPVKTPVDRLPGFRRCVALPQTERAADETLALPVHPALTKRDMQKMASAWNALGGLLQSAAWGRVGARCCSGYDLFRCRGERSQPVTGPYSSVGRASPW